ncbi:MAG: hypothetical protein IKN71_07975 [Alphaproteobacteria bacterium]|nr:hypothetical protein [Alphaproteobacteria bacterium]
MKKNLVYFVAIIVAVVISIVVTRFDSTNLNIAGGGLSLKKLNGDTTVTSTVAFAEVNTTTNKENLAQVTSITNWERQRVGGYFYGFDIIGTASTEFGIMCPTYDARLGVDFEGFRLEGKVGCFTRNSVKSSGFDPQFANYTIAALGEPASVANCVQISYIAKNTRIMLGHQGGSKFYSFKDGNYYISMEQHIKNLAVSGGIDFTETTSGYASVKYSAKNDVITLSCNKLGCENENYLLSYNHNNISLGKGVDMSVGSALWLQKELQGLRVVSGIGKGSFKLFAEAGGLIQSKSFTPVLGLGMSYKL